MWKVLNELVGLNKSERVLPSKLIVDGNETNDSQAIAETFNNYFANIGKTMGLSIVSSWVHHFIAHQLDARLSKPNGVKTLSF